jgi:hypothetical protein
VVSGNKLKDNDGLQFYLDPGNRATAAPVKGIFTLSIDASGALDFAEGNNGVWISWKHLQMLRNVVRSPDGYRVEARIPWSVLGTKPGGRMRFHAVLNNVTTAGQAYREPLSGNENEKPYTWSTVNLID